MKLCYSVERRGKRTSTHLAKLWEQPNYNHLRGNLFLPILKEWLWHNKCWSITPTPSGVTAPQVHLQQRSNRKQDFSPSKDMAQLGWLATLAECAQTARPAVKVVERIQFQEGRGGVRGLRGGGLGVEGLPMQKCKSWGCMLINKTAIVSCKCELPLAISLHVWYSPCVPLSLTIVKVAWSTVSNSAF